MRSRLTRPAPNPPGPAGGDTGAGRRAPSHTHGMGRYSTVHEGSEYLTKQRNSNLIIVKQDDNPFILFQVISSPWTHTDWWAF